MNAMVDRGFGLATSQEEVVLRRKLLFRILRDFDFNAPVFHGEMITAPATPDQNGLDWSWRPVDAA